MELKLTRLTGPYNSRMYMVSGVGWSVGRLFVVPIERTDLIKGYLTHKVTFILLCEGEITGLSKPKTVVYKYASPIVPHHLQNNEELQQQLTDLFETSVTYMTSETAKQLCG